VALQLGGWARGLTTPHRKKSNALRNVTKGLGWEDNIKMDLREIGFEDVDWIHLAQDRDRWRSLVNTVMNLRVP
jgi:hypothetical protein